MSEEEKFYKYVILRDRDGNYLLPYTGVQGLADVAFTGNYRDLKNVPELEGALPAIRDGLTGVYGVSDPVVFNDSITLDYSLDYIASDDLAKDSYVVNEEYVYNTSHYILDKIQEKLDAAYNELNDYTEEENIMDIIGPIITGNYKGSVNTYEDLLNITGEEMDVYYVSYEEKWYICTIDEDEQKIWVPIFGNTEEESD